MLMVLNFIFTSRGKREMLKIAGSPCTSAKKIWFLPLQLCHVMNISRLSNLMTNSHHYPLF
ncbi:unnamed protein product [Nezara viridula]|uniref:Uncharacterized protein n=1 Tax=Nezara viridula TaxID=85310 RepID=A0A9P0DY39_NEZVI|nr:unnamed protein product [Nezara viridula]